MQSFSGNNFTNKVLCRPLIDPRAKLKIPNFIAHLQDIPDQILEYNFAMTLDENRVQVIRNLWNRRKDWGSNNIYTRIFFTKCGYNYTANGNYRVY